jgi:hypothetical protein
LIEELYKKALAKTVEEKLPGMLENEIRDRLFVHVRKVMKAYKPTVEQMVADAFERNLEKIVGRLVQEALKKIYVGMNY